MRFAFIGLALSHPYAFAPTLRALGHEIVAVWDYDLAKADAFAAAHSCAVAPAPEAVLAFQPDGVFVTSITRDHVAHARPVLEAGIPAYVDKLTALVPEEAEGLIGLGTPVMACSALRFLPDFQELIGQVRSGQAGKPLTARAEVYHGMQAYLRPGNTWQDDPELSGGVLMNMGVHAVDLLVAALGADWAVAAAEKARRVYDEALSEDQAAMLLRGPEGQLATVQIVSGTERHYYALTVTGTQGDLHWQLPDPGRPVSDVYAPMLEAFAAAVRTRTWPVPPREMIATVGILAAARQIAG